VDLTLKMKMDLPHVEALGEYNISVQLHPEVTGTFRLAVKEEK
jgi:ribosomal protein L9